MASGRLLHNVQALRAIAAFMVVLYHARLMTPIGTRLSFDFGNAGVDIFFLISGFIIAHVTTETHERVGGFLLKRAIRVVPLYWALTLLLYAGAQIAPQIAGAGGQPGPVELAKSLFFIPYFDASGEMHPVLFLGWTLDYEMFFYLMMGLALALAPGSGGARARLLIVSALLAALVLLGWVLQPKDAIGQTYSDALMIEFAIGLWLNQAFRAAAPGRLGAGAALGWGLCGLAGAALLVAGDYGWPQIARELKWGIPALMIVAAALALERGGRTAGGRRLMLLGEASYAIYLTHPFVIKAASLVYARLGVTPLALQALALLGLYALVALIGVGFHLLVEKPLIRLLRHLLLPRARPSVATGLEGGAA